MAQSKINADVRIAGKILGDFSASHYLTEATDIREALLILDGLIYALASRQVEVLTAQIDGVKDTFQTAESFTSIRVILNGLEQSQGEDADYVVPDDTHIQFYRPLKTNETLKVEYVHA